MSLPSSGQLTISMINTELGRASNSANSSLQQLANLARGGTTPYNNRANPKMSDWYGYTHVVGFSFSFSGGFTESTSICTKAAVQTLYAAVSTLVNGTIMYTDAALTSPFNGGSKYHRNLTNNNYVFIQSNGAINTPQNCTYVTQYLFRDIASGVSATCGMAGGNVFTIYTATNGISVGKTLYSDSLLTTPFNGQGFGFLNYPAKDAIIVVDSSGVVQSITNCGPQPVSVVPVFISVYHQNFVGGAAEPLNNEFYLYDNTALSFVYSASGIPFNVEYTDSPDLIVGHNYTAYLRMSEGYGPYWCYTILDLIHTGDVEYNGSISGGDDYGYSTKTFNFTVTAAYEGSSLNLSAFGYIDYNP